MNTRNSAGAKFQPLGNIFICREEASLPLRRSSWKKLSKAPRNVYRFRGGIVINYQKKCIESNFPTTWTYIPRSRRVITATYEKFMGATFQALPNIFMDLEKASL